MKRLACFILAFIFMLPLTACNSQPPEAPQSSSAAPLPTVSVSAPTATPTPTPAPTYSDPELARAVALGIDSYAAADETVTYKQFFTMLDNAVGLVQSC